MMANNYVHSIRSDYSANYYEYEIPLKITDWGSNGRGEVWPLKSGGN